jgi:hypothetical protein
MRTEPMEAIKPGNPFLSDLERIGADLDNNVTVMFLNHENNKEFVIVDTRTGERLKLLLDGEGLK